MTVIIKESDRLTIRHLTIKDHPRLAKMMADPRVMQYEANGIVDSDGTMHFLKSCISCYEINGFGIFAVVHKNTNKLIGVCGIYPQTIDGPDEIELLYRIQPNYWGLGIASEAAKLVLEFAREELKRDRIIAAMDKNNIASIKVAQKLGMVLENESEYRGIPIYIFSTKKKNN